MRCFSLVAVVLVAAVSAQPTARQADNGKPVFAHYMIGGILDEHTRQDIVDAKAVGLDAFALNLNQLAPWSESTVDSLFNHADELGFGLFFSFDMAPGYWQDPNEFAAYLQKFIGRPSHFKYNGKPLVSTFGGEKVSDAQWAAFKATVGDMVLVPGFYEAAPSESFFGDRQAIDGVFNWNAWAFDSQGKVVVPTDQDTAFQSAAKSASKLFMMGISPLQFKHMDSSNNWYRRGEDNLEHRLEQALAMQPDMLELQTWNDAGESHYMGNIWDEPMAGSPAIKAYVDGYDHKGYLQILPAFIQAWKRGDTTTSGMVPTTDKPIQGAFWHHTLLVGGNCAADPIGKPTNVIESAEDAVSGIILVAKGMMNLVAVVNSGTTELGTLNLTEGYNKFKFGNLVPGKVQVEVWDGSTLLGGGYGPIEVTDSADLCNYNFQVVGFPG